MADVMGDEEEDSGKRRAGEWGEAVTLKCPKTFLIEWEWEAAVTCSPTAEQCSLSAQDDAWGQDSGTA